MVPGGQVQSQQYNAGTVVECFVKASCLASVEKCHFGKFLLYFFIKSCLFVVYSFHSPQVLLEFCSFMQLSAVSFLFFFFSFFFFF